MEGNGSNREDPPTSGTAISLARLRNHAVVFFVPLLCFTLYLLYPRNLVPGIDLSVVVLIVAAALALPYVKGRARWSIMGAMVLLAIVFPQNIEVKMIWSFLSIITIVLVEYVARHGVRRLFLAVVFVSTPILALAWVFTLFLADPATDPPGVSFFGGKVGLVNILLFGLMGLVYLLLEGRKGRAWVLFYILAHLYLFTLFASLSKQVYVACIFFSALALPALFLMRRNKAALHIICSILAVYLLSSVVGTFNIQSRVEALGAIGGLNYGATKDLLEEVEFDFPKTDSARATGTRECYYSEQYFGCLQYNPLCAADYLRPFLDEANSITEVRDIFFTKHPRLAGYLGDTRAQNSWLAVCSRKVVILDRSDRLSLVINGLRKLKQAELFGAENLSNLHHINFYSAEIEIYTYYHNFVIDLGIEAGLVILGLMLVAILLATLIAVRGPIDSILLGAMVAAFVALRLLSGSHYELFYLILLMGMIFYREYAETE